jgi:hypothetical protein
MNPDDIEGNTEAFEDIEVEVEQKEQKSERYIPVGELDLIIKSMKKGVAQSGNPKVDITFSVMHESFRAPREWTRALSLSASAAFMVQQFVCAVDDEQAAAVKASKGSAKVKIKADFIGRQLRVTTKAGSDPKWTDIAKFHRHPSGPIVDIPF